MITKETRAESLKKLDKNLRYTQIIECLKNENNGLTAREIANKLGSNERNYAAPRCTELVQKGKLEVVGKRYDTFTKTNVAVYKIKNNTIDMGKNMKCYNCEYGYVKLINGITKEVYCRKINQNLSVSKYKKMKTCLFFSELKKVL